MQGYSKPILGLSTIQSATFVEFFQDYGKELVQAEYNHHVVVTPVRRTVCKRFETFESSPCGWVTRA